MLPSCSNHRHRLLVITLFECMCCQGYCCLHPFLIAGSRNEVKTNQKHKPYEFVTWGWWQPRLTRGPWMSRWWWPWPSGANKQKEEDEVETVLLVRHAPATTGGTKFLSWLLHSVHVQVDGMLFQGLWHKECQQHNSAAVPASVGAGIEENRWHQGAQSW